MKQCKILSVFVKGGVLFSFENDSIRLLHRIPNARCLSWLFACCILLDCCTIYSNGRVVLFSSVRVHLGFLLAVLFVKVCLWRVLPNYSTASCVFLVECLVHFTLYT